MKGPSPARSIRHETVLAGDRLEGRDAGSAGYREVARYVAARFDAAGLSPAGTDGFFQPVPLLERCIREQESSIEIVRGDRTERLQLGRDAYFSTRAPLAPELEAEAVFLGYGVRVPQLGHDDFAGLDLKGKIAVTISGMPAGLPPAVEAHLGSGAERQKALIEAGVIGTLSIPNPRRSDIPWSRAAGMRLRPARAIAAEGFAPAGAMRFAAALNPETATPFTTAPWTTPAESPR